MLNVFQSDAFGLVSLTASINRMPFAPGYLGSLGLFAEKPITTTTASFESQGGWLSLVVSAPRGTHNRVVGTPTRKLKALQVPHFPLDAAVKADDALGIRAFGTEDQEVMVSQLVNDKLEWCRINHETTHEYLRVGAIQGQIYDGDGTTLLYNLFTEFGMSETSVNFDFTADAENILATLETVTGTIEEKLGATPYSSVMALCSSGFYSAIRYNPQVAEALTALDPSFQTDQKREGFEFGNVSFVRYRGSVGAAPFIPAGTCRFFPVGVPDLFQEVLAPADFIETVGQRGQRIYAKQAPDKWGKSTEIHTQSNVLPVCTIPEVLIEGVDATP